MKLLSSLRRKAGDVVVGLGTLLATLLVVAALAYVLVDVTRRGAGAVSLQFLFSAPSQGLTEGGIFPALFGTVALVVLMTVAVVPVGVATAVYLHEYASPDAWFARVVRVAVTNLAGVPSIVFGLFGLGFFVQVVGRNIDRVFYEGAKVYGQPALVWAALTMAVLTLPVVIVSVEEALRHVPQELREVSYALGATRFQTVLHVVLPQARSGILTGGILAVSRGSGEVAPILFTGVAYYLPHLPQGLSSQFMDLGYHVYVLATQSPDVDATAPILYATVLVLLALTFLLNFSAVVVRMRMRSTLWRGV